MEARKNVTWYSLCHDRHNGRHVDDVNGYPRGNRRDRHGGQLRVRSPRRARGPGYVPNIDVTVYTHPGCSCLSQIRTRRCDFRERGAGVRRAGSRCGRRVGAPRDRNSDHERENGRRVSYGDSSVSPFLEKVELA